MQDISTPAERPDLQFVRASGLAQARLQLAVLSGNRRRALEQIDRLVALDSLLERAALGRPPADTVELADDLAQQRLALASEKLVLTSQVHLPRLEPAFGAGVSQIVAPDEELEIVEDEAVSSRLRAILLWTFGFLMLCLGLTAAVLSQL